MTVSIHVGDVGTVIRLEILDARGEVDVDGKKPPVNVSSATALYILLESPTGVVKRLMASLVNDGTDGLIQAETLEGTISESGAWKMQGLVEFGTKRFHAEKRNFAVVQALIFIP